MLPENQSNLLRFSLKAGPERVQQEDKPCFAGGGPASACMIG